MAGRAYHEELESALAAFLEVEACHVFSAGYLACMGALSTLVRRGDALLLDKSIHSCLWDGALLSNATLERFNTRISTRWNDFWRPFLTSRPKAIAVDGVYSMEGHIASLPRLADLSEKYGAILAVDDAHGFGVLGREGRGTVDHFRLAKRVDVITGSFSKALGSTGGFVAGSRSVIEYLRSNCRQLIFSAGISASQAAAAQTALAIMQKRTRTPGEAACEQGVLSGGPERVGRRFLGQPNAGITDRPGGQGKVLSRMGHALGTRLLHGHGHIPRSAPGQGPDSHRRDRAAFARAAGSISHCIANLT